MQRYTVYYVWKLLYMFRVVPPPITNSAYNCISASGICHAVTATCRYSAPDDGWRYHPKHVEQFPDINKLCKVASCWLYIEIYLRFTEP